MEAERIGYVQASENQRDALAQSLGELFEQCSKSPEQPSILESAFVQFLIYRVAPLNPNVWELRHSS